MKTFFSSVLLLSLSVCTSLEADDATHSGRFHIEHPTLLNLGFEWAITGDDNRKWPVPNGAFVCPLQYLKFRLSPDEDVPAPSHRCHRAR